jgi:dolichyl-phosphate beta-glucosyltransferase
MSNQIRPQFSLVIPAFSEAHRLPLTFRKIKDHQSIWEDSAEIIVVVEPSNDNTLQIVQAAKSEVNGLSVIANTVHRGKGYAVKTGMLQARGQLIFFTDADLSTPLEDLDRALKMFHQDASIDIVVGNRQHPGSQILRHQSVLREFMGKSFNQLVRKLAGIEIRDTQCGFKGFRLQPAREIFSRQCYDGFSFDVEILLLASAMGYSMVEMPVHWSNSPESKVNVVSDSLKMLKDVIQVRRQVKATLAQYPLKSLES